MAKHCRRRWINRGASAIGLAVEWGLEQAVMARRLVGAILTGPGRIGVLVTGQLPGVVAPSGRLTCPAFVRAGMRDDRAKASIEGRGAPTAARVKAPRLSAVDRARRGDRRSAASPIATWCRRLNRRSAVSSSTNRAGNPSPMPSADRARAGRALAPRFRTWNEVLSDQRLTADRVRGLCNLTSVKFALGPVWMLLARLLRKRSRSDSRCRKLGRRSHKRVRSFLRHAKPCRKRAKPCRKRARSYRKHARPFLGLNPSASFLNWTRAAVGALIEDRHPRRTGLRPAFNHE